MDEESNEDLKVNLKISPIAHLIGSQGRFENFLRSKILKILIFVVVGIAVLGLLTTCSYYLAKPSESNVVISTTTVAPLTSSTTTPPTTTTVTTTPSTTTKPSSTTTTMEPSIPTTLHPSTSKPLPPHPTTYPPFSLLIDVGLNPIYTDIPCFFHVTPTFKALIQVQGHNFTGEALQKELSKTVAARAAATAFFGIVYPDTIPAPKYPCVELKHE